jgi:RHS repeat-associated protein
MFCSNGGCDGPTGRSLPPEPFRPFYIGWRNEHLYPFGTGSVKAGDRIFMYCAEHDELCEQVTLYNGGFPWTTLDATSSWPYSTYSNWSGGITATRPSGEDDLEFIVTVGDWVYVYENPEIWGNNHYGNLKTITDNSTGDSWTYTYTSGKLTSISAPEGTITLNWLSNPNRLDYILFANGSKEAFLYTNDSPPKLKGMKEWFNDGVTNKMISYSEWTQANNGLLATVTDYNPDTLASLGTSSYAWDANYNLTSYTMYGQTYSISTSNGTTTVTAPSPDSGKFETKPVTTGTNERTNWFKIKTSSNQVLYRKEEKKNTAYRVVKSVTEGGANTTSFTYGFDIQSNTDMAHALLLRKVTSPAGDYSQLTYNSSHQLTRVGSITSGNSEQAYTQADYDGSHRMNKMYTGSLWHTDLLYNTDDQLRKLTTGTGVKTWIDYNADKLVSAIGNGSATTTLSYNTTNRIKRMQAPSGVATRYVYSGDVHNLLTVYQDVASSSAYYTSFGYEFNGVGSRLTSIVDAENRKTGYGYDSWGRLTSEVLYTGTNPWTSYATTSYTYDSSIGERLSTRTDPKGQATGYTYYPTGKVNSVTWKNADTSTWGSASNSYYLNGKVKCVTTSGGDCGCSPSPKYFDYNSNGLLQYKTSLQGGTIEYTYDSISRPDTYKIPDRLGTSTLNTVDWGFDAANRLTSVNSTTMSDSIDYTYNTANQVDSFTYASATIDNAYDSTSGALTKIDMADAGNHGRYISYEYNSDGLKTSAKFEGPRKVTYGYDNLYRLTREAGHAYFGSESCVHFDGTQNATIASGGALGDQQNTYVVEARVYLDSYPAAGTNAIIFQRGTEEDYNFFQLKVFNGYLWATIETPDMKRSVPYAVPLNTRFHVAATWTDGARLKLYYNGSYVGQSSRAIEGPLNAFTGNPTIGTNLKGYVDEVVVRNVMATSFTTSGNYTSNPSGTLGLWHFDEGSGTNADDAGSDDKDATVPSSSWAKWDSASENCLHFNGSQSATILANGNLGAQQNTYVVEARVLVESYPSTDAIIFERGASGSQNWFRLRVKSDGYVEANIETQATSKTVSYWVPLNEWFHVAATWTASGYLILYYNGFAVGQSNATIGGPLKSTTASPTMGNRLTGKIDEGVARNSIPSSFNVDTNYGSTPTGALGWWHFNEGTGTTSADSSTNGRTVTVSSTGWSNAVGNLNPAVYEYRYAFDKVGNRTTQYKFLRTATPSSEKWVLNYNTLNQLTDRNRYLSDGTSLQEKWIYTYDLNGNLTQAEKQNGSGTKQEKWVYTWNPRNQMSKVEKFTGTGDTFAGKVEYQYCLSCDNALSERIEYNSSSVITSWKRYEYDGLNLLRVDEHYDTGGGTIDGNDPWRTLEVNTHSSNKLGNLIAKRAYRHTDNDATPNYTYDYVYLYDALGQLYQVLDSNGVEVYHFAQDAFGNELAVGTFSGDTWSTVWTYGITEHQTGKWVDPFTGFYFFHARWFEPSVGRFLAIDPRREAGNSFYSFCRNCPTQFVDTDGRNVDLYGWADCMKKLGYGVVPGVGIGTVTMLLKKLAQQPMGPEWCLISTGVGAGWAIMKCLVQNTYIPSFPDPTPWPPGIPSPCPAREPTQCETPFPT